MERHFSDWEDWELEQRRHALSTLIKGYEDIADMSRRQVAKLRRYQREFQFIVAEQECRVHPSTPVQLVLFVLE